MNIPMQVPAKSQRVPKPKLRFDEWVPNLRPNTGIHPLRTVAFATAKHSEPGTEAIHEESSYVEFAWEFLRRNRFYQALVDGRRGAPLESEWGYRWHDKVPRSIGLEAGALKPYWETHEEGQRPRWSGIDDFAAGLPPKPSLKKRTVTVELKPGQALVVYDLSGLIYGRSPLQMQLLTAWEHMDRMATRPFPKKLPNEKPMHRKTLLERLKLFDKLSQGLTLAEAAEQLEYRARGLGKGGATSVASRNAVSNVAEALSRQRKKAVDPVTTAYEDANLAYELVYRHGYLRLLGDETSFELSGPASRRILTPTSLIERIEKVSRAKNSKNNNY